MTWAAMLTRSLRPPKWTGEASQYLLLTGAEEQEQAETLPTQQEEPPPKYGPLKTCSQCKQEKPSTPEYFFRATREACGLMSECKGCHKDRNNKRRKPGATTERKE